MRRLAGEWIFRQMQMQIPKVYWRVIEESACRRGRKRQSPTRRRIVRWCPRKSGRCSHFGHRRKGSSDRARLAAPAMSAFHPAARTLPAVPPRRAIRRKGSSVPEVGRFPRAASARIRNGDSFRTDCGHACLPGRASMRALPYFSASVSSPNHSGRWKSGRKWTMGAQEPKWGWIVSSHL